MTTRLAIDRDDIDASADTTADAGAQEHSPQAHALALLRALADEDGQSLPRLAKRLGLAASQLQRLCTALGEDPRFDGLGLVQTRIALRNRECLWLTARGHRLLCDAGLASGFEHDSSEYGLRSDDTDNGRTGHVDSDLWEH